MGGVSAREGGRRPGAWPARGRRRATGWPRRPARAGSGPAAGRRAARRSARRPRCRPRRSPSRPRMGGGSACRRRGRAAGRALPGQQSSPASTKENGPKVLTISSSAPAATAFCSMLSRRAARKSRGQNSDIVERPPAARSQPRARARTRWRPRPPANTGRSPCCRAGRESPRAHVEVAEDYLEVAQPIIGRAARGSPPNGPPRLPAAVSAARRQRLARLRVAEPVARRAHPTDSSISRSSSADASSSV